MNQINYLLLTPNKASEARSFCLKVIEEVYGFAYRSDWHGDLDDLLNKTGVYTQTNKGAFFIASDNSGSIVGTIGIKNLTSKPNILGKFKKRGYRNGKKVASIWRAYVDKKYRGKGIGKNLVNLAEDFAKENDYKLIYLHTSLLNPNAVVFWQKRGYQITLKEDDKDQTIHMEKQLAIRYLPR